ncbi:polysaccharide lyase 8 family protein [Actinokineospora sp. HUAS TT18]|uniref:polysaccharide lyase 8 family protein n=1 Tax=Actinokineospora sp. HUAS TT18 TaxID=3447451 RepID=UPI003F51CE64
MVNQSSDQRGASRRTLLKGALLAGFAAAVPFGGLARAVAVENPGYFPLARRQWLEQLIGRGLDTSDPTVAAQLNSLASTARSAMNTYVAGSTRIGLWNDLPLQPRSTIADSARVTTTARRLRSIALAWAAGTLGADRDRALAIVADGLTWLGQSVYSVSGVQYGNWYDWFVSGPQALNDTLLLTFDALDPAIRDAIIAGARHLAPEIPQTGTMAAAANRVLICDAYAGRGLLSDNESEVLAARDNLIPVLAYARPFGGPVGLVDGNKDEAAFFSNDGFYPDGSFIQHGQFPYVGGYGASFLTSITNLCARTAGTPWSADAGIVIDWMHASFEPWLWRALVMDTVRGRGLASLEGDKGAGTGFIAGMIELLPATSAAQRVRLESTIKAELGWRGATPTAGLSLPQTATALRILRDPAIVPRAPLTGTSVFGPMDRVLHRRPDWAVAFAMHSLRMADYETGSGQNLRGWYSSDAATYLYTADRDQFGNGYWCTVDAYRLPGTTVDTVAVQAKSVPWRAEYHNPSFWAGGVTAGNWGAAGIELTQKPPSTLRSKVSRFFFEDCYVCLGAGVTVAADRTAETTIENRQVTATSTGPMVIDGTTTLKPGETQNLVTAARWAHIGGVGGYVLLRPADVRAVSERRTGKFSDIDGTVSGTNATTVRAGDYLTLGIQHGTGVTNGTYAYMVLPGAGAQTTAARSTAPRVRVIDQSVAVQSVREEPTGRFGAVFFAPAATSVITVDTPCAIAIDERADTLVVNISDPTQSAATVTVDLAIDATSVVSADPRVRVGVRKGVTTLTVDVAGLTGSTVATTLATVPLTGACLVSGLARLVGGVLSGRVGGQLTRLAGGFTDALDAGDKPTALAALQEFQRTLDGWAATHPESATAVAGVTDLASRLVARTWA